MLLGRFLPLSELDRDIVFHLVGDHLQPEAMLEFREAPRFSRNDLMMTQSQHEQVGEHRNPKGLFMPFQVATHLMLAQAEVRFQISIDELDTPAELVQPHDLPRRHIRQIGHQELCVSRADVTPGFAQHQGHFSNVAKTQAFGINPIGFAVEPLRKAWNPGCVGGWTNLAFVIMTGQVGHQVLNGFILGGFSRFWEWRKRNSSLSTHRPCRVSQSVSCWPWRHRRHWLQR